MKRTRWDKRVPCAIDPAAWGCLFDFDVAAETTMHDGIAVVRIQGPLTHHAEFWWDSYDGIRERVEEALAQGPKALVLAIDSPGGYVSGCFETASALRAACDAAKVPMHAYVDGCAASAAYALASSAQSITVPKTGMVGSIGVITTLVDWSKANAEFGLSVEVITSGARKADGNPNIPITDDARSATQAHIDELAEVFFAHVAAARPALGESKIRGLQAGIFIGKTAVATGLADQINTLEGLLATLANGPIDAPRAQEGKPMTEEEKARAALQAMIDDAELADADKDRARAALAALDGSGETSADEEAAAQIAGLTAANAALTLELTAARNAQPTAEQVREAAAVAAVDLAIAEGRISATSRDSWLSSARASLTVFQKAVAGLPAMTKRVTSNASSKGTPEPKAIESEDTEVNRLAKKLLGDNKGAAARIG